MARYGSLRDNLYSNDRKPKGTTVETPRCKREWDQLRPRDAVGRFLRPRKADAVTPLKADAETEEFWIDGYEVARRTGLNVRTVWSLARRGEIPKIAVGRRVLFDWKEVSKALRRMGGK